MELELIGAGADARVEFVLCEGWCSSLHKVPAEFTGDALEFHYVERYSYADGSPAYARMDVRVIPIANGVRVTVTPADHPDSVFSADLPRIDERFGLAVAAEEAAS